LAAGRCLVRSIHQQEGEMVEGVDGGQVVVELDGIEQPRAAVPEHDIVEMQIAVAAAHETGRCALVEKGGAAAHFACRALAEALHCALTENPSEAGNRCVDGTHESLDALRFAMAERGLRGLMAFIHDIGEIRGQSRRNRPRLHHMAQQGRLIETAHAHGPLDDLPIAAEHQPAVTRARDGRASEIDLRREPPVDYHLAQADGLALLQGREVHVGKAHRALDLPGLLAGQKHQGAVGLEPLDAIRPRWIGRGVAQEGNHLSLIVASGWNVAGRRRQHCLFLCRGVPHIISVKPARAALTAIKA
jgi:hypothetical protein